MMEQLFKLSEHKTTVRTEVVAGLTTFLTMAYIIFVQPSVLSGKMFGTNTGLDFGAVTTATCVSAVLATAIMALYARYPIAQAPGMGENFFFVFSALPAAAAAGFSNGWQVALGVVFVSGVLFLILSLVGLRELIFNAVGPTFLKMDIAHALTPTMLPFVFVFLFMLTFDAIGTLIGVCEQAGFMRDNRLPRAKQAMVSDAIGTVAGAALGTSTVTSFIESAAGVEQGGRTGLTGLVVAALFLLALFFSPLIAIVGSYPPITAPALTIVGAMMMQNVAKIEWKDFTESIPAFLIIIGIPLSHSIADGLALGFISYAIIKGFSGRSREISWLTYALAVVLVLYFVFVRSRMG